MRDAFVRALMAEMERDPRIVLITGDLGFGVLRPVKERYPERLINAGIAEQSMVGLAAAGDEPPCHGRYVRNAGDSRRDLLYPGRSRGDGSRDPGDVCHSGHLLSAAGPGE